jgi:hypothetical protein
MSDPAIFDQNIQMNDLNPDVVIPMPVPLNRVRFQGRGYQQLSCLNKLTYLTVTALFFTAFGSLSLSYECLSNCSLEEKNIALVAFVIPFTLLVVAAILVPLNRRND